MRSKPTRGNDGKYPAYAWPGGFPITYLCKDGGNLCPACANCENGSIAQTHDPNDKQWFLVSMDIHWEGDPIVCDHCYTEIESAYGPVPD